MKIDEKSIEAGPTPEQTMRRGDWLNVVLCEWEQEPREERVFVRQIPIPRIEDGTLQAASVYEAEWIKLLTGKDDQWVEQLTDESHERIVLLGRQLNFPRLGQWVLRKGDAVSWVITLLGSAETIMDQATAPLANVLQRLQSNSDGSRTKSTGSKSPSQPSNSGSKPTDESLQNDSTGKP